MSHLRKEGVGRMNELAEASAMMDSLQLQTRQQKELMELDQQQIWACMMWVWVCEAEAVVVVEAWR